MRNMLRTGIVASMLAMGVAWCVGVVMTGCVEKDSQFGSELVPPHQLMASRTDSTVQVRTYIGQYDSVQTSFAGQYQLALGSHVDPLVGRLTAQVFSNYAPLGFDHSSYFGIEPVIDSMTLAITTSQAYGDTTAVDHWIDVYRVEGHTFKRDSAYYSNFDMSPYISGTPIASFQMRKPGLQVLKLPMDFAQAHLDNTQSKDNIYYVDTAFHEHFNGLYIKFRDPAPAGEGTLFQIDLSQCMMTLFYHNKGYQHEETPAADTTIQRMLFVGDYVFYNTSFMMLQHDYTQADPAQGGVVAAQVGDTVTSTQYGYIEGLAGLKTWLRIDTADLRRIKEQAVQLGYNHVALQRAELQVNVVDPGYEEYQKTFTGLGIYHSMTEPDFLTEYNPVLEGITGSGYTSSLGGGLIRSQGQYRFDVTSYVQQILTGREGRFMTELGPAYAAMNSSSRTRIYGFDSPFPPKLILTYILVK